MTTTVTVVLQSDGLLVASLGDGRALAHVDPVVLAELLLDEGLTADQIRMPDWREENAPMTGHKIALMSRMRKQGREAEL